MRAALIINPIAGRGGGVPGIAERRKQLARDVASARGVDLTIAVTERRGHGAALARESLATGRGVVIAWGGDGTVNEVAGPLIGSGAALGIVPGGSGDGLARSLTLPRSPALALARAFSGTTSRIDVGYFGDRHFLNVAGIGFDAVVAGAFSRRTRRGARGYVLEALARVWRYAPQHYEMTFDDEPSAGPRFVVVFANGRQYGNGLVIAPRAVPWDGRLDVVSVESGPAWRLCWRARRLFFRSLAPAEGILRRTITRAAVSGRRMDCHVDGEVFEATGPVVVRIDPSALCIAGGSFYRPGLDVG